nr:uncharacterized protein K02A2.6-like [Rhipicephalus microplus]
MDIFVTFNLSAEDSKKFELVKKKYDEYFIKETNFVYESACFHKQHQMPAPYWQERAVIAKCNGMLLKGTGLVLRQCLRKEVLTKLHDGRKDISKTRALVKELVWWPGLGDQLARQVKECASCARFVPQNSELAITTLTPSFAWEQVGIDLCFVSNCHYLVVVDYLSRYPEVALLPSPKTGEVMEMLKSIFARHGPPKIVVTDNEPQFSCTEFEKFVHDYSFGHVTASPRYPQANGEVERMVQTIRRLILKFKDSYLALLAYRTTPGVLGCSPAEILMGRRLRTTVPMAPQLHDLVQPPLLPLVTKHRATKKLRTQYYNKRHRARKLNKHQVILFE